MLIPTQKLRCVCQPVQHHDDATGCPPFVSGRTAQSAGSMVLPIIPGVVTILKNDREDGISNGTLHNVPLLSLLEDIKVTSAESKHRAGVAVRIQGIVSARVPSRFGPVDKSKNSAGTHSGSSRIINWEIAKDGIYHPLEV